MKTAQLANGQAVSASNTAPRKAHCPACGGRVFLRCRRLMKGGLVYYWQHRNNRHLDCQRRARPLLRNIRFAA